MNTTANDTDIPVLLSDTSTPFEVYTEYYQRQIVAGMIIIASITGIIGNSLVIVAVLLTSNLRTATNVFVVSLSVSDLVVCLSIPVQAVAVLHEDGWPLVNAYWLCVASSAVTIASGGNSITNLALIAVNRWIGITKPRATVCRIYTRRNVACMVAFSWVLPVCLVSVPLVTGFGELGYEPQYNTCSWVKANRYSVFYSLLVVMCYFPVQFVTTALCYISIF